MGISEPTIPEMLVDHCTCEVDTMNKTPILTKEGIAKPLEHMFVVLIGGDVVWPNKVVHQVEMDKLIMYR